MEKVQAVVFDVFNTLLKLEFDEEGAAAYLFLSQWLSYHGLQIGPKEFRRLYLSFCDEEIRSSKASVPDIDIGRVFSRICASARRCGPELAVDVAQLALLFRILTTKRLSIYPGVLPALNQLRGEVKLGVLSNSQRLFTIPELTRFSIAGHFDAIVFSSDLGACKPDPAAFAAIAQRLSVAPASVVFVGDSLRDDICGAKAAGMKTIWVNRSPDAGPEGAASPKPDFVVADEAAVAGIVLQLLREGGRGSEIYQLGG